MRRWQKTERDKDRSLDNNKNHRKEIHNRKKREIDENFNTEIMNKICQIITTELRQKKCKEDRPYITLRT